MRAIRRLVRSAKRRLRLSVAGRSASPEMHGRIFRTLPGDAMTHNSLGTTALIQQSANCGVDAGQTGRTWKASWPGQHSWFRNRAPAACPGATPPAASVSTGSAPVEDVRGTSYLKIVTFSGGTTTEVMLSRGTAGPALALCQRRA